MKSYFVSKWRFMQKKCCSIFSASCSPWDGIHLQENLKITHKSSQFDQLIDLRSLVTTLPKTYRIFKQANTTCDSFPILLYTHNLKIILPCSCRLQKIRYFSITWTDSFISWVKPVKDTQMKLLRTHYNVHPTVCCYSKTDL